MHNVANIRRMADMPMVLCEITGKEVPADETVVLDGKRVCAEGKAILLERLKSGKSDDDLLRPRALVRLGAWFLDGLIVGIPPFIACRITESAAGSRLAPAQLLAVTQAIELAGIGASLLYVVLMHWHSGQTVGKMACGLKVVNRGDLSPLKGGQALVRGLWHKGSALLAAAAALGLVLQWGARGGTEQSVSILGLLGLPMMLSSLYLLASAILAAADSSRQLAIHDRLAQTRVVRVAGLERLAAKSPRAQRDKRARAQALDDLLLDGGAREEADGGPDENPGDA